MGDSGNQLDDSLQAQNPETHHGSILRISVNSNMGVNHQIPNGNPFKNSSGEFRSPVRSGLDRRESFFEYSTVGRE